MKITNVTEERNFEPGSFKYKGISSDQKFRAHLVQALKIRNSLGTGRTESTPKERTTFVKISNFFKKLVSYRVNFEKYRKIRKKF